MSSLVLVLVSILLSRQDGDATQARDPDALSPRNANYDMSVQLSPEQRTLTGEQVLTWRNISDAPTSELRYHVYYNAWRNDHSSWFRTGRGIDHDLSHVREGEWGWSDVHEIVLLRGGEEIDLGRGEFIAPDDGNPEDRTVLRVALPDPVRPGEEIRVRMRWTAKVPRTFARTGVRGDYFLVAQWFPKVGVLESGGVWNCHQFIQTEFYADFGVYDVALRVPSGWVVGATGREQERIEHDDGTTTHRYRQADVHDFAWTTSPDVIELHQRFEDADLPPVDMRLLLQPDHADLAERYFEATAAALEHYGKWWGPYPYGHITIVDPAYASGTGGMEYPTLFTGGARWIAPRGRRSPEGVTVHEAGHQFWYGIVANNEFEHAWLDEGFNTYSTTRVMERVFPEHAHERRYFEGFIPVTFEGIVPAERTSGADHLPGPTSALLRDPQSRPSWQTGPSGYRVNAYDKGALTLRTLENYLGWEVFQRGMSTYFRDYAFSHPEPADFFATMEAAAGQDLDWFFEQTWEKATLFDYAVDSVASARVRSPRGWVDGEGGLVYQPGADAEAWASDVFVRRWGDGVFPISVRVRFEDGHEVVERWDGVDRWKKFSYERAGRVERVEVDPDHQLVLDVDYANNGWMRESRADIAATKWSSKWMIWVQATMEAFAFFS